MKIGIFDSGIGGLSVLHEAYHQLPEEEYIFYADTDHVPYGLKTPEEIRTYSREAVAFLVDQGVDGLVIACNTATSVAVKTLREEYSLPIISMEPAVKPAVELTDKRILVIATPVTLKEERFRKLMERVDPERRVDLLPAPKLVSFAEKEEFSGESVVEYLRAQFSTYPAEDYGALVLGCTHFNYFKDLYRGFFPEGIRYFDGNAGTIRQLARRLNISPVENGEAGESDASVHFSSIQELTERTTYFVSGRRVEEPKVLEHFMRLHNRLAEMRKIL